MTALSVPSRSLQFLSRQSESRKTTNFQFSTFFGGDCRCCRKMARDGGRNVDCRKESQHTLLRRCCVAEKMPFGQAFKSQQLESESVLEKKVASYFMHEPARIGLHTPCSHGSCGLQHNHRAYKSRDQFDP